MVGIVEKMGCVSRQHIILARSVTEGKPLHVIACLDHSPVDAAEVRCSCIIRSPLERESLFGLLILSFELLILFLLRFCSVQPILPNLLIVGDFGSII